jgi:hypothetical protein
MSEWKVCELVVHLLNLVILVFEHLLVLQSLIGLNKVKLLLPLIIANLLLIDDHLLPKVLQELIIRFPLREFLHVMFFLVGIYLVDDGL